MLKKAAHAVLVLIFWIGMACPDGHAVNLMSDVKKAEKSVEKSAGKVGSGLKKSTHSTEKMLKKSTKKLKFHKPKL